MRHHHEVGLFEETNRSANGYGQFGVAHLERTLRIKRLTDLGRFLTQIGDMGDTDRHPSEALRQLDTDLATTVERLQRVRVEVGQIRTAPFCSPRTTGASTGPASLGSKWWTDWSIKGRFG